MKIGFAHITDMHIGQNSDMDLIMNRVSQMCNILISNFAECKYIYLVFSGDLANEGKEKNYIIIQDFIKYIIQKLEKNNHVVNIVIAPGNHDCDIEIDESILLLRKMSINNIENINVHKDTVVVDSLISTQNSFWKFYSNYNNIPESKIYYELSHKYDDHKVDFVCLNTAWMFEKDQKAGSLFYPIDQFDSPVVDKKESIRIAVYHHPTNWLNPDSKTNNKRSVDAFLMKSTSMQFIGHEHESLSKKTQDIKQNKYSLALFGSEFSSNRYKEISGFQLCILENNHKQINVKKFEYKDEKYVKYDDQNTIIDTESRSYFSTRSDFTDQFEDIKIPISNGVSIKLDDMFVYPDLDIASPTKKVSLEHICGENITRKYHKILIEGDSQSGKTSYLYKLFLDYHQSGHVPIYIEGSDISETNIEKLVQKRFRKIYEDGDGNYDSYMQLDKDKRIVIIDDFNLIKMNSRYINKFMESLDRFFSTIIISIESSHSLVYKFHTDLSSFKHFRIKPLGFKKTNDLISKYINKCEGSAYLTDQECIERIRDAFDKVRSIVGDKVMPTYPVFILSILQSLEYKPLNINETSFGYCYQTLIHLALVCKSKVQHDKIDAYINLLKEYAYYIFTCEKDIKLLCSFDDFFTKYSTDFVIDKIETVKDVLISSKLIHNENDKYAFKYKYIYYFLVAKYFADIITTEKGREEIRELFTDIHKEKNANILVFITHHTSSVEFIEECVFSTLTAFENTTPITLEASDPLYDHIREIIKEVSDDVLDKDRDPITEREQLLTECDEAQERYAGAPRMDVEDDASGLIKQFYQSYRSIEIVGQIVKNRRGSLSRTKLADIIEDLYLAGFRTISHLATLLIDSKAHIIETAVRKIEHYDDIKKFEKSINELVQSLCLTLCLNVFSKILFSTGTKELDSVYFTVSNKINTPAAKLVSFSIHSYFNKIDMQKTQILAEEFRNNPVALEILKARIKSYIYNNQIDIGMKQKIAQIFGFQLQSLEPSLLRIK